jgi:hypothetical protein
MHESDERGVLLLNGKPMPEDALCRLLGLDKQILTTALTKIVEYGVAKEREEDGAIFSKRMVHDEHIRQVRKNAGFKGGNPLLLNQKSTTGVKQKSTPSSSSSSSTSSSEVVEGTSTFPREFFHLDTAEILSGQGKYLEALSARTLIPAESISQSVKDMMISEECFETYLRNRAAENWKTRLREPIRGQNWLADLQRFASSYDIIAKAGGSDSTTKQASRTKRLPANWREIAEALWGHPVECNEEDLTPDQWGDVYRNSKP